MLKGDNSAFCIQRCTLNAILSKGFRWAGKQYKCDPALSYNGAKTATRKYSFKSSAIKGRAKIGKKKRNHRRQMKKGGRIKMIGEHLKLLTMP